MQRSQGLHFWRYKTIIIMATKKKEKKVYADTDLVSFPVYMPFSKYTEFNRLCKSDRMPMTKIAEQEIDKYIKRKQA